MNPTPLLQTMRARASAPLIAMAWMALSAASSFGAPGGSEVPAWTWTPKNKILHVLNTDTPMGNVVRVRR